MFVVGQHRSSARVDTGLVIFHLPRNMNETHDDRRTGLIRQVLKEPVSILDIGIHDDAHLLREHDHLCST